MSPDAGWYERGRSLDETSPRAAPRATGTTPADVVSRATIGLIQVFAVATAFGPTAASVVLVALIACLGAQLVRGSIRPADLSLDALVYVAVFSWKAFTLAIATSVRNITQVRGGWYRLPYLVIGAVPIDRSSLMRILHLLFAVNSALVVVALGQRYAGVPDLGRPLFDASDPARLQGLVGHPNTYAGCLAIVLVLNLCMTVHDVRRFAAYTPFLVGGLVLAGSRGYVLGVAVSLVVLVALSPSIRRSRRWPVVAALLGGAVLVAFAVSPDRFSQTFVPERNSFRTSFWEISWDTFVDHPVTGIGSGRLPGRLEPYVAAGVVDNAAQGHSLYLHELAEDGIVGLVLVVGTYGYFLVKYLRLHRRTDDPLLAGLALAAALALLTLLIEGVFDFNFGNASVAFVLSLVMALVEGHRRSLAPTPVAPDPIAPGPDAGG